MKLRRTVIMEQLFEIMWVRQCLDKGKNVNNFGMFILEVLEGLGLSKALIVNYFAKQNG